MSDDDVSGLFASRLIACAARRLSSSFGRGDITRIWVLDLGWFSIVEAENIVQSLIDSGYLLKGADGRLSSTVELSAVSAPLGWVPSPSEAMSLSPLVKRDPTPPAISSVSEEQVPSKATSTSASTVTTGRRLIEMIANSSGLEKGEVARRSTRKRRALVLVAPWCSLLLLASELGLDLEPLYGELVSSGVLTS
ncbi:MAG TPA: DUF2240 family protein [Candidatus Poseidoniales archaeon]|nr:DUF2240 family protein [Candidatus Poseidoniales archaeon]